MGGGEKREDGRLHVPSRKRVDGPLVFTLAVKTVRLRTKMRSKHGTLEATQQLILKPQPVHGTAHSVVVG